MRRCKLIDSLLRILQATTRPLLCAIRGRGVSTTLNETLAVSCSEATIQRRFSLSAETARVGEKQMAHDNQMNGEGGATTALRGLRLLTFDRGPEGFGFHMYTNRSLKVSLTDTQKRWHTTYSCKLLIMRDE